MWRSLVLVWLLAACASGTQQGELAPAPVPNDSTAASTPHPPPAPDPELERRVARVELRLLEKEAQLADLQARLDEARREVVRAMAKLQTLATRAEAASAMAEAELALRSLGATAEQAAPELAQARQLVEMGTVEFNRQNYGGALYLANQAKSVAGTGRGRLPSGGRPELRPGEVLFALPLRLAVASTGNVREGPGVSFPVAFTLEKGAPVLAYSYAEDWVRITDVAGRSGWIFHNLVGRP